jgi:hypothetical protein
MDVSSEPTALTFGVENHKLLIHRKSFLDIKRPKTGVHEFSRNLRTTLNSRRQIGKVGAVPKKYYV